MRPITIRQATINDAEGINYIIQYWVAKGIANEKEFGYLRLSPVFEIEQLKELAGGGGG